MSTNELARSLTKVSVEIIARQIYHIRGKGVMLDEDLARLYGVETKYLIRQVKRNMERFPEDFMLQLSKSESLRCQNVTLKKGRGQHRKYLPFAFTEQGVAMLSSILRSHQAVMVNVQIMRAFVMMKRTGLTYAALKRTIEEMGKKYDSQFQIVFQAIQKLIDRQKKESERAQLKKPSIGFRGD